jgi:hypothetical protein
MNEKRHRVKCGTLGLEYVVQVTFKDKENIGPLVRVINRAFMYFEETRKRIKKAVELEEKEKKKNVNPGGLL